VLSVLGRVGREGAVDVVEVPAVGAAEVVAGVIAVEVAVAGADNAVVPKSRL
jgi:hypothetical protein